MKPNSRNLFMKKTDPCPGCAHPSPRGSPGCVGAELQQVWLDSASLPSDKHHVCDFDQTLGALNGTMQVLKLEIVVSYRFQGDPCGRFQSNLENGRSPMPNSNR